jgi:uncharacterized protein
MASVELIHTAKILECIDASLSAECIILGKEIEEAIQKFGLSNFGQDSVGFSYEVDGYGNSYFMDDANIPSLLSLPYLGYISKNDPLYLSTRHRVLSTNNPYFFKAQKGLGLGDHTLDSATFGQCQSLYKH